MESFPFGRPVMPVAPRKSKANEAFVLGAYPSALHVNWTPRGSQNIQALPVDNEPSPFWTGGDAALRFERWRQDVSWDDSWGSVCVAHERFNGSSGRIFGDKVLAPLGISIDGAYISDCLNLYHMSAGVKKRLDTDIGDALEKLGRAGSGLLSHPSENQIVKGALTSHCTRIAAELEEAKPKVVITLGNAALRVLGSVIGRPAMQKLKHDNSDYGKPIPVSFAGHAIMWYPLCHPGQRDPRYLLAHGGWADEVRKTGGMRSRSN
jgi:hypothetical protein